MRAEMGWLSKYEKISQKMKKMKEAWADEKKVMDELLKEKNEKVIEAEKRAEKAENEKRAEMATGDERDGLLREQNEALKKYDKGLQVAESALKDQGFKLVYCKKEGEWVVKELDLLESTESEDMDE